MAKAQSRFVCQECGAILSKWVGQCEICKAWNSVIEEIDQMGITKQNEHIPDDFFVTLSDDSVETEESLIIGRRQTQIEELNRVIGGGIVDGSIILLGGPPGIGKSTLLLQVLTEMDGSSEFVYISAEESVNQVLLRARRLNISNNQLKIAASSNIHQIISSLHGLPKSSIVIIDSIQTILSDLIQSPPGSISQVRFCTQELVNFAKKNDVTIIIVGHITKDGAIAGPKTLEHMVDCVLYFEGDRSYDYRILRCEKNRFGPTDEIGVFSMTGHGLEEVANPSAAFLSGHNSEVSGVAVFAGIEGTRPILSEIQALVSHTNIAIPRRSSVGFDTNRLIMLVAVLSNRCKLNLSNKEVYLNVAGGLRINEPAADLAVMASIISSSMQKPLPKGSVFFGEVSLSGEIRPSHLSYARCKEAQKLGFKEIYCSHKTEDFDKSSDLEIRKLKMIREVISSVMN
ncbi:MAG: DNA repair protein RadA [Holosporales bacterium]|jgi:DNA repair protein RadA/Sms|nr:DNA repair protein RadA [Holosporales bacterium]